ncbi:MAG: hypothetical protein ACI9R3_005215 [Verrucomicrobiales bacterium]|jgi:hypothetical protein
MNFDELRNRYFEELATPEGGDSTRELEAAIHYVRGIQDSSCPATGRERRSVFNPRVEFADEVARLVEWGDDNGIATEYRLGELPPDDARGTEHFVWFEQNKVRRLTYETAEYSNQGPFGQTIETFEQDGMDGKPVVLMENRKASPSEYLERLYLQNILFHIENQLAAVSEFGIETTQPLFVGEPVSAEERSVFLEEFGFIEWRSPLTWYSRDLQIALSDVAIRNLVRGEGTIFPFDIWARRLDPSKDAV